MIVLKIDLNKIDKSKIFHGKNNAQYIDLVVFENREPDQYGNDFVVKEGLSKEDRAAGVKAQIVGNGKNLGGGQRQPEPQNRPQQRPQSRGGYSDERGY